jgi:hypothetical protein
MGLLINQGVQDTSQDNKFNPIVAKDVLLQITAIKLAPGVENTLEVTLKILEGEYKNRPVFDRVQYAKTAMFDMTWKYRALRACAGVPYKEGEAATIDIEKLLLNKAVRADLGIRKGKNKDGEEQDYQDIKYLKPTGPVKVTEDTTPKAPAKPKEVQPTPNPAAFVETYQEPDLSVSDEAEWE